MPVWAVVVTVIGTLVLAAALAAAAWFGWRTYERRALLRLVVRTEAVESAAQALSEVISRLSDASDEDVAVFAEDPESPERRALYEVALKTDMLTDELDRMRLPRSQVSVAEALADAAYLISVESRVVKENDAGTDALDHLGQIDLEKVRAYVAQARRRVHEACAECGLEETNVYGGGLYL